MLLVNRQKKLMILFGGVIGYMIVCSGTKRQKMVIGEKTIPQMLSVKKQFLECYWCTYDPSIVIGEKWIPIMLLVKNRSLECYK